MTYIEFFDKSAAENVVTCLLGAPERVIFVGDNSKRMKRAIEHYQKIFTARGDEIAFLCRSVPRNDLEAAVNLLTELVETYPDCVFDLTGGEGILMLALGIVYARNPDKNIQLHKFNLRSNAIADCDRDGIPVFPQSPALSVEENIQLHGGEILYGLVDGTDTYCWDMNGEFLRDIAAMWEICRENTRNWNVQMGILGAVEALGRLDDGGRTTIVSRDEVEAYLLQRNVIYKKFKNIISALMKAGLLTWFDDESYGEITISYKNPQVKRCLTKAGQILEMQMFATARGLRDKNGELVYQDAMNGVVIDWDGDAFEERTESAYDTRNEIDILLMHNLIPVFISCKNGVVTSEELYKLSTVAERFGGKYAKKVLIATALGNLGESAQYLRQRAEDMGITILENVQELTQAELERKLKNLWSN